MCGSIILFHYYYYIYFFLFFLFYYLFCGGQGVQLQTRMGPTKFYHFKTDNLDPSGLAHEILFPMGTDQLGLKQVDSPFRITGTSPYKSNPKFTRNI